MSDAIQDQAVQALLTQMQQLQQQVGTLMQQNQTNAVPVGMSEDDTEFDNGTAQWDSIIRRKAVEAKSLEAKTMITLFGHPPNLQDLKHSESAVTLFSGVPEAANPRRNRIDSQWWHCQHKIELSMNLLIHYLETNNVDTLGAVGSYLRSAWE